MFIILSLVLKNLTHIPISFRIQLGSTLGLVDPVIPHMNIDPMPLDSALSVDAVLKNCTANGGGCIDDEIQRPDGPVDSHSINSVDSGMHDGAIENTVCPHAGMTLTN